MLFKFIILALIMICKYYSFQTYININVILNIIICNLKKYFHFQMLMLFQNIVDNFNNC